MISFSLSLIAWSVIPVSENIVLSNINVGILYLFAVSSLSIYGIIMAGWASNSKYAFLGALEVCCSNGFLRGFNRICNCYSFAMRWFIKSF